MDNYDVVIVGAGLAGLQCARLLGQTGMKALLVDRKEKLSDSIHTTGIFVRRTLEDCRSPRLTGCRGVRFRDNRVTRGLKLRNRGIVRANLILSDRVRGSARTLRRALQRSDALAGRNDVRMGIAVHGLGRRQ